MILLHVHKQYFHFKVSINLSEMQFKSIVVLRILLLSLLKKKKKEMLSLSLKWCPIKSLVSLPFIHNLLKGKKSWVEIIILCAPS